jgi:hypothetical protein
LSSEEDDIEKQIQAQEVTENDDEFNDDGRGTGV